MGIDATAKTGVEIHAAGPVPSLEPASHALAWPDAVTRTVGQVESIHLRPECGMAVIQIVKSGPEDVAKAVRTIWRLVPPGSGADRLWIVDKEIDPDSWDDLLWALSTRSDPGRDTLVDYEQGRFAFDATNKLPSETHRQWGAPIRMNDSMVETVSRKWDGYGLPGSGTPIWR
ncbi:MAG: UbiD family decarboxylase [Magnetococcales bacterium]|nr:UbiD family decarboxylase [Magnetococcales bacterium]